MTAEAKTEKHPETSQTREPAKGGITPAHENAYPSGDSPKPHGDKLQNSSDEAAKQKNRS